VFLFGRLPPAQYTKSMKLVNCVFATLTILQIQGLVYCESESKSSKNDAINADSKEEEIKASTLFDLASESSKDKKGEQFEYQAHTSRLMNLIVHSMYVNPEVFIRELLANACDAIDKLRREAFGKADLATEITKEAKVLVRVDKAAGTISFIDNGIGMSKQELKDYLGTIAKSGTAEALAKIQESKDASTLIGQFGVGFYSAFLVANQVAVASKSDKDPKQHLWISNADSGDYTILEDPRGTTLKRGTEIVLKLKDEHTKFLDQDDVKKAMETYASFYPYPIFLEINKTVSEEVEEIKDETESSENKDKEEAAVEDESVEKKEKKTIEKIVKEEVQVNSNKPLWMRDPKDVSAQEYTELYKALFKASDEPLTHIQFKAEGDVDFRGLIYIPKKAPNFGFNGNEKDQKATIHLYVRRAFITDKIDDFLPSFLHFVKAVVDSDDLSLNISRESLQNNSVLRTIKAKVLSKVFEAIRKLADSDAKKYKEFFDAYGYSLKLELANQDKYKSKIAPLLRYQSSKSKGELISLDEYISRKKENQKNIYYIAGTSVEEIEKSPFIEKLKDNDYELLYMIDPVDEHTIRSLSKYEDFEFQNAATEGLKLPGESEDDMKILNEEFKPLMEFIQNNLSEDVEKVLLSTRLVHSPCAVVATQNGWTGNMERVIMAQASAKDNPMLAFFAMQKKVFEINPKHELISKLLAKIKENPKSKSAREVVSVMFDSSLVQSGYTLKNTKRFSSAIERLSANILSSLSGSDDMIEEPKKAKKAEKIENTSDAANTEEEENNHDEL
jgi:heat shock protein 90kDa beta